MIALIDNAAAMLVGGLVLICILVMMNRSREAATERTVAYVAKKEALSFATWLELDLANAGSGMDRGEAHITRLVRSDDGLASEFTFLRKLDDDDDDASTISYQLVEQEAGEYGGEEVSFYSVERRVNDEVVGESTRRLTDFQIEMLDADGQVTDIVSQARLLHVQFSLSAPFGRGDRQYLRSTYWSTTLPIRDPQP